MCDYVLTHMRNKVTTTEKVSHSNAHIYDSTICDSYLLMAHVKNLRIEKNSKQLFKLYKLYHICECNFIYALTSYSIIYISTIIKQIHNLEMATYLL